MRRELTPIRARVSASLDGDVLEVGFGSGLNVPHYPPAVTRVRAVDPATIGRTLAAKRVASSSVPVEYVDLDGQALSLESASIDHVLTTWTLRSVPDVDRALSEIRRVLRSGGLFHFVEHGRSPDPNVAVWQNRADSDPAAGCRRLPPQPSDRPACTQLWARAHAIGELLREGPRPFGYMFEGVATKPDPTFNPTQTGFPARTGARDRDEWSDGMMEVRRTALRLVGCLPSTRHEAGRTPSRLEVRQFSRCRAGRP